MKVFTLVRHVMFNTGAKAAIPVKTFTNAEACKQAGVTRGQSLAGLADCVLVSPDGEPGWTVRRFLAELGITDVNFALMESDVHEADVALAPTPKLIIPN